MQRAILGIHGNQEKLEHELVQVKDEVNQQQAAIAEMGTRHEGHAAELATTIGEMKTRLEETAGKALERHEANFNDAQAFAQATDAKVVQIEAAFGNINATIASLEAQIRASEARTTRMDPPAPAPLTSTPPRSGRWMASAFSTGKTTIGCSPGCADNHGPA